MKIPKQIKIGGHIYKVVLEPDILETSQGNSCGTRDRTKGTIAINSSLIRTEQEAVLFHEILHTINNEMNEEQIELFAQALYQVFSDNKLLR